PSSTGRPPTGETRSFPPTLEAPSTSTTRVPGGAPRDTASAADNPAMPAPITTTRATAPSCSLGAIGSRPDRDLRRGTRTGPPQSDRHTTAGRVRWAVGRG